MSEQEQTEMLKNAVITPVSALTAVEIDSLFRANKLIDIIKQEIRDRPFCKLECSESKIAILLLDEAVDAIKDWEPDQGVLFITDFERIEEKTKREFWVQMNLLRESWGSLECHVIFFLLPGTYRMMLIAADHLASWISLKLHILGFSEHSDIKQSFDLQTTVFSEAKMSPKTARQVLEALEPQLIKAINKGMDQKALIRRYYLPMFDASIAISDLNRAQSIRKKISENDIPESDLPDWWYNNYELDVKLKNLDKAHTWVEKLLDWSVKYKNNYYKFLVFHAFGLIAENKRELDSAEKWLLKALEIYEKQDNKYIYPINVTYQNLGAIAQLKHDFNAAEKYYKKVLEIKGKQDSEYIIGTSYHQLAMIAEKRRDFDSAETFYKKALKIFTDQNYEYYSTRTYYQLGNLSCERMDFILAEKWYKKSLKIAEKNGDDYISAIIYGQLGILAGLQGKFEESGKYLIKAIQLFSKYKTPSEAEKTSDIFQNYYKQADLETKVKLKAMWDKAINYLKLHD